MYFVSIFYFEWYDGKNSIKGRLLDGLFLFLLFYDIMTSEKGENMKNIYIFGHKKPDTDSVTASIALSYLKNQLGMHTEPRVLGQINPETKFVLSYFKVKEPGYLNDVKLQLKDIHYHKGYFLKDTNSIYDSYLYMSEKGITGLPIVKENRKFCGLITIKHLANEFIKGDFTSLDTSYQNILNVLEGQEVLKFDSEIKGELLVASYRSTTFLDNIILNSNMILIVGDRHSIIEYAVKSGVKLIILVGEGKIKPEHLQMAQENHVNIIQTAHDTLYTVKLLSLSNYIRTILPKSRPISFDQNDYLDDFIEVSQKLRHTNYPVLNKNKECLGLLRNSDIHEKDRKQVILVDHNEKNQSVDGIEEAEILEIIDHHNLGSLTTNNPINFRNMAVGSTNTILYRLYVENQIKIPKEIAGLMLSGILSDTLIFQSPTTTELDRQTAKELANIASVSIYDYGMEMLKAGTSLKGKTKEEILYNDFKIFSVEDKNIGVGQIFTMNFEEIRKDLNSYVDLLNQVAVANDYYFVTLFVTDVIKNGSYVIYSDRAKSVLERAYMLENIEQGHYFENIVSRKKQIIPYIMDALTR